MQPPAVDTRLGLIENELQQTSQRLTAIDDRFNNLEAGNRRMEAMLRSLIPTNSDAATYAQIAAIEVEVKQDKLDLVEIIKPQPSNLARLHNTALSLASLASRTLSPLSSDGRQFRGKDSAKAPPLQVFSPALPPNVTKRNSSGHSTLRPGLPIRTTDDDSSSFVLPLTPELESWKLDKKQDESDTTKMKKRRAERAVQHELDGMKMRIDDVLTDGVQILPLSRLETSVSSVDEEDASAEFWQFVDHAEVANIDEDIGTILRQLTKQHQIEPPNEARLGQLDALLDRLYARREASLKKPRDRITSSSASSSQDRPPPILASNDPPSSPPPYVPVKTKRGSVKTNDESSNVRKLPPTPWSQPKFGTSLTSSPFRSPPKQRGGNGGGGGDDDSSGNDDDDDENGRRTSRGNGYGNGNGRRPSMKHHPISSTDNGKENIYRRRLISSSLYYPVTSNPLSNQVAWLSNSIEGPYEGKLDRLTKCAFQLMNDSPSAFYIFYASLRSFLTGCGFNGELLPHLQFVTEDLDLTVTPIGIDMPPVGAKDGGTHMPQYYWQEQHDRLGAALFALLASKEVISKQASKSHKAIGSYDFSANGFQILQQLLLLHHPRLSNTQAPGYLHVKESCPRMKPTIVAGEQLDALMSYFMEFTNWELQLKLYHEARVIRDSEYHLLFVRGLSTSMRSHVNREEGDLQVFSVDHRNLRHEPPAPNDLHAKAMYNRLRAIIGPLDREAQALPARSSRVSSIVPHFDDVMETSAPAPEQILAWCAEIGDAVMVEQVVSAIQGHYQRRQPQAEKRPVGLCKHLACSKQHSPDDCCICSGQRHPISKCWHIIGLPAGKQHMADQFKIHQQQSTGPWALQSSVRALEAQVSSIHTPASDLVSPSLSKSGVILTEAEGDLHDVKEMDYGFTSSFVRHHLESKVSNPSVSAIDPDITVKMNLPDDGPQVNFVSRLGLTDTVVAHVDTGATVMVSNVTGEIHGAIPTTSHCGTAMTGSRASIDALGTWMVDLVGSTEGKDLFLSLQGTTQITEFQRRSLSLHALKELGFDCAHVLTQKGNFLEITSNEVKHVFPLLTINGGDYVEMRIHRPPPATVAAFSVARLDLAKNFKADGLYHLLHLRYGCPGRRQMELILKSDNVKGVPANVSIPEVFRCPICDKEKTNSLPVNGIADMTLLPIGARFGADYGFYNTTSVRGFTCFLLITEYVTGYKWVFCRRSKQPPVNLTLWFIKQMRLRLGVSFAALRTDGGGELWGSKAFRNRLLQEAHCLVEPTGAYYSNANGLVERAIGVVCVQAQLCLFASGLDVSFWCFALSHATMLCNFRPRVDTKISSHEALFKVVPNYSNLAIWGSSVYVVNKRLTRRRPESATITGRFLGYAGSHHIITYKNDLTGAIQYAHHTAIDELDLQNLPGDRGPAAKFLSGIVPDARHELELRQAIADLTPTLSPWLSDRLVSHHVPYDVTCNVLGVVTEKDEDTDRLRLVSLTPGSPAERYLIDKNVLGHYILTMNGIRIRSVKDIRHVLHDYHDPDEQRGPAFLTGITILFGLPAPAAPDPEQIEFSAQDHATARVVWSLIASSALESLDNETVSSIATPITKTPPSSYFQVTGGGTDPRLVEEEMRRKMRPPPDDDMVAYVRSIIVDTLQLATEYSVDDIPIDDIVAFVQSIMASDESPICPKFWHHAMKDPVHRGKWIEAMFKHLDSCYSIGTFGPPRIPPANVTVLPAVIVLKMVINAVKQINSHKVRVCVHGGHQIQGKDFEESFAHTVLGRSIKICVAISCYLAWLIFHFDIHNAFQTCPDNNPETDHTWLRINQTWLDYFRERFPEKWPIIQALLDKNYRPEQFAVEMFMFVQGRTDASRKWGELVEEFIFTVLGLLPNRSDPCTYSGLYHGKPVILCRATDDFLLICQFRSTYDAMISAFREKWTVHALDQVKLFFGVRFICSDRCVTLDQNHKIEEIVSDVFGRNHRKQPLSSTKGFLTPMIAGTEYANQLAACVPFTPSELKTAQSTTFGFGFRHVLGGCMHCALWTRLDILTACLILAQYQASPGALHFRALRHIVGYLRLHPDIPLTFQRSSISREIASINFSLLDPPLVAQVNSFTIDIIPSCANVSFDSDPLSFTSCDNLFQSQISLPLKRSPITDDSPPINISRISPPITECLVDANLPGGLYERMATSGGSIEMGGTTVIAVCQKQTTMAESSTEAELIAAAYLGKILRWLVLFMSDMGLPFQGPIPIAEDNAATRIIAHSGKVTRNVRHVAIKTLALQGLVRNDIAVFNAIGTENNRSDHFTKALTYPAFRNHILHMLGLRFLTQAHAILTMHRNREDADKDG